MRIDLLRVLAIAAVVAGGLLVPTGARAAPPANDAFADATTINPSSLPFSETILIDEATSESWPVSNCGVANDGKDVWYAITPTSSGTLHVGVNASFYYQFVGIYRQDGSGLAGLTTLTCNGWFYGQSGATFTVNGGSTYYIEAGSTYAQSGSLTLTLQVVPPPVNDNFANATQIDSLPYTDSVDSTAAGIESGEPPLSCGYDQSGDTVWYSFTPSQTGSYTATAPYSGFYPQVAVYSGSTLGTLSEIGCRTLGQQLTFHANVGTTYYFQVGGLFGARGTLNFNLNVAPAPTAGFYYSPSDPSIFDPIQFNDQAYDPGGNGFSSEAWDFGDGGTALNPGCCPTHHYSSDGTYRVTLTVTTTDGRVASTSQDVLVKTHDVSIAKVTVPQSASVGQTRPITVGLVNARYPETVQVHLLKSSAAGWQEVGVLTQYVPVRGGNRTTNFGFNYTFAPEDSATGRINFQAIATIQGARDAIPADNSFTSLPTRVPH